MGQASRATGNFWRAGQWAGGSRLPCLGTCDACITLPVRALAWRLWQPALHPGQRMWGCLGCHLCTSCSAHHVLPSCPAILERTAGGRAACRLSAIIPVLQPSLGWSSRREEEGRKTHLPPPQHHTCPTLGTPYSPTHAYHTPAACAALPHPALMPLPHASDPGICATSSGR